MKNGTKTVWGTLAICLLAGTAMGQTTNAQGTIDRQRARLDAATMAPSTGGWLNDSTTNRFWAFELNSSVNDTFKHPNMQRTIYHRFKDTSLSSGVINTASLDDQAGDIAAEIVARYNANTLTDGNYTIQLLNLNNIDLHEHASDDLDDSVMLWNPDLSPTPGAEPWANFLSHTESPTRASPWKVNGVTIADAAITYLCDQIVIEVESQISPSPFPAPARILLSEEKQRQHGDNSLDNLGEIQSIFTDVARRSSEPLYGNFDLWDSTPTTTVALEVFSGQALSDMLGWNTASLEYVPNSPAYPYSGTRIDTNSDGILDSWQYPTHQRPNFDHEFLPMYKMYMQIIDTVIDGSIGAALSYPLSDPKWGDFKWSNNRTSGYFSPSYPFMFHNRQGVLRPANTSDERYGWLQSSYLGSANSQAPMLYPPSDYHEQELEADLGIIIGTQLEREARAWLRYSRTKLDHTIFSLSELESMGIDAPRHVIPHITRVGTVVRRPNIQENPSDPDIRDDLDITTKENVRNQVALCKAKGINEIYFWGNPDYEYHGTQCDGSNSTSQYNWDSTNDLLSQVYDYTLHDIYFNGSWIGASNTLSATFSEEHTHDFVPTVMGLDTTVQFAAEFETGTISTLGDQYTFVTEALDGGGPWANATYTLEIFNFKTGSYHTIQDLPVEWHSNSTRRTEFNDTDSDGYSNEHARVFDDDITGINTVYDRKRINAWENFALPVGTPKSNFISGNKMKFQVTVTHNAPPVIDDPRDKFRLDLVQLYETECENNNILGILQLLLGDMNNDQQIDTADMMLFMQNYVSNPTQELDLNNDGKIDFNDVKAMNDLVNKN